MATPRRDRVFIFDTTLRDGEQSLPASLSTEQKLRIARQLARLNVDIIEAGFPISSPGDFQSVQTIAREIRGPVICGLARTVEKDILICAEAVKPAKRPRIHTFIGTSTIHAEKKLRKSEHEILDMAVRSVKLARRHCDDVEFSPEDSGRTGIDFLCRIVEAVIAAGATTVNIPDTVGYTPPEQFASIIQALFNRVPNIGRAVISVHCHNDLGMATANSLTAVSHGARQIECAMNGLGERAGNAALEEVAMALKVRRDFFNVDVGVDTTEIMHTSRLVREVCNVPVQPNKAIVGANAFSHSSGIHQDGVLKSRKTYEIMSPQSIGLKENRMVLTSRSGSHMVRTRLVELGYAEGEFDIGEFYKRFIDLADKKGTVYDDDLIALMESKTSEDLKDDFTLDYLHVTSGRGTIPTATVRVSTPRGVFQEAASGDGAVDSTTKAIDRITGFKVGIHDFHIDSVGHGGAAQGRVTIVSDTAEGMLTGTGTSTDIVEASAIAYMNVVNKFSRMKRLRRRPGAARK